MTEVVVVSSAQKLEIIRAACSSQDCIRKYNGVKFSKAKMYGESMFFHGYKYCRNCEVYFLPEDCWKEGRNYCKCCHKKLRMRPRKRFNVKNQAWVKQRDATRI